MKLFCNKISLFSKPYVNDQNVRFTTFYADNIVNRVVDAWKNLLPIFSSYTNDEVDYGSYWVLNEEREEVLKQLEVKQTRLGDYKTMRSPSLFKASLTKKEMSSPFFSRIVGVSNPSHAYILQFLVP